MFDDSAAKIFDDIKDTLQGDQALSVLTVVGDRNVGKSTIASLLSGNSSMFYVSIFFTNNNAYECRGLTSGLIKHIHYNNTNQ